MASDDVGRLLAANVVRTRFEDLPVEVVEVTKRSILDTLGVTLAASTLGEACGEIVGLVRESGACGNSSVLGQAFRLPSWLAGFANGSMTHELDYDDVHDEAGCHPSACAVMAGFAVAEEVGGVRGDEFITAIAAAVDLCCRIGFSIRRSPWGKPDWFMPSIAGVYAATAVAGRLLGLDERGMESAFGHTLQQVSGSFQMEYSPGGVTRGIRDAFPIKAGIIAALMARRGLTGPSNSLEGRAGLYDLYFRGTYHRESLTDALGERYEGIGISFKPWPSSRTTHGSIDAALQIIQEHDLRPEQIASIETAFDEPIRALVEPLQARRRPQTATDAKVSLPYTLGVIAARRRLVLNDFTPSALQDPVVLALADRVTGRVEPRLAGRLHSRRVEIKTRDGSVLSNEVEWPYGNPRRAMLKEDLVRKFEDCASHSAKPLPKEDVANVLSLIDRMEDLTDVGEVIRSVV